MLSNIKVMLRNARVFFSRSEWTIRLLRLSRLKKSAQKPGLVMVQIDGLSHKQFQRAIDIGHLPFLKSLIQKERYVTHPFYSGLPSNTPAVQGEIFYGVKTCVPAFSFVDHQMLKPVKMNESDYVASVEAILKTQGEGLLTGGSSYSNIYAGGAEEAHFCWGKMGFEGMWHAVNFKVFPFLVILYIDIFIRTFALLIAEIVIAVLECIRGTFKGRVFKRELELIYLRALICVALREFITVGACMDIMRGLPIIHLNFLGYDEQAHGRGPASKFAHWSLRGIDAAIKRINHVIKQSVYREYDLWVYSDHGQDKTEPYLLKYGRTLEDAVKAIFTEPQAIITAMGPVGHIYPTKRLNELELYFFAQKLIDEAHIPLVITREENNKALAWTKRGQFILPDEGAQVFGAEHPFLEAVTEDMMRVCFHPDAGEFIILGWAYGDEAISFPLECGAHAGAGMEETKGFALLPLDVQIQGGNKNYLRPMDLRQAAQEFMAQKLFSHYVNPTLRPASAANLRVMSYNVHGCKGMDGHISVDRIARVIKRYDPDIVALQELDVGRLRSGSIDQAQEIALRLGMSFNFHPSFSNKNEHYGNAILSRHPMVSVKKEALPRLWDKSFMEPRGAILVAVDYQGIKINIINTHLSLWPKERLLQMKTLLSKDWLQHPDCIGPLVLCGDMNMVPDSPAYKEICKRLQDSQLMLAGHEPVNTWFAGYPLRRLDHIFVTEEFSVNSFSTSHTSLDRAASDHLPIVVDLNVERAGVLCKA